MSSPATLRFMLQSLLWTSADNSWAFLSHSLADNCQTTSLFPRIGLSCGTSLELSSREGGILFHTIVPPHSLGSQYEVCSLSMAIPVTLSSSSHCWHSSLNHLSCSSTISFASSGVSPSCAAAEL